MKRIHHKIRIRQILPWTDLTESEKMTASYHTTLQSTHYFWLGSSHRLVELDKFCQIVTWREELFLPRTPAFVAFIISQLGNNALTTHSAIRSLIILFYWFVKIVASLVEPILQLNYAFFFFYYCGDFCHKDFTFVDKLIRRNSSTSRRRIHSVELEFRQYHICDSNLRVQSNVVIISTRIKFNEFG